jgi:hypothetical protein
LSWARRLGRLRCLGFRCLGLRCFWCLGFGRTVHIKHDLGAVTPGFQAAAVAHGETDDAGSAVAPRRQASDAARRELHQPAEIDGRVSLEAYADLLAFGIGREVDPLRPVEDQAGIGGMLAGTQSDRCVCRRGGLRRRLGHRLLRIGWRRVGLLCVDGTGLRNRQGNAYGAGHEKAGNPALVSAAPCRHTPCLRLSVDPPGRPR